MIYLVHFHSDAKIQCCENASKINFIIEQIIRHIYDSTNLWMATSFLLKICWFLGSLHSLICGSNLFSHPSISVCPFRAISREIGQWILHVLVKMTRECKRSNRQTSGKIPLIHVENNLEGKTFAIVVRCSFPGTFSSLRCAFKQRITR